MPTAPHGEIGIFNRSHYEDVVTVGVMELAPEEVWRPRLDHIRDFERTLTGEGTPIVKCFFHISKDEQKGRLEARLAKAGKRWKFDPGDLEAASAGIDSSRLRGGAHRHVDRARALVCDSGRSQVDTNVALASLLVETLQRLDPRFPEPHFDDLNIR